MRSFLRKNFFPFKKKYNIEDLIILLEDQIISKKVNNNFIVNDVSSLNVIGDNSIIWRIGTDPVSRNRNSKGVFE